MSIKIVYKIILISVMSLRLFINLNVNRLLSLKVVCLQSDVLASQRKVYLSPKIKLFKRENSLNKFANLFNLEIQG